MNRAARVVAALAVAASSVLGGIPAVAHADAAPEHFEAMSLVRAPAGVRAPDFSLRDLAGRSVSLAELRGRHVVLNFWASWCAPCEMEMPSMQRLSAALDPARAVVVAVNFREPAAAVERFTRGHGLDFTVLLDVAGTTFEAYRVETLPFTLVLGRDGEVLAAAEGPRQWDSPAAMTLFRALDAAGR